MGTLVDRSCEWPRSPPLPLPGVPRRPAPLPSPSDQLQAPLRKAYMPAALPSLNLKRSSGCRDSPAPCPRRPVLLLKPTAVYRRAGCRGLPQLVPPLPSPEGQQPLPPALPPPNTPWPHSRSRTRLCPVLPPTWQPPLSRRPLQCPRAPPASHRPPGTPTSDLWPPSSLTPPMTPSLRPPREWRAQPLCPPPLLSPLESVAAVHRVRGVRGPHWPHLS